MKSLILLTLLTPSALAQDGVLSLSLSNAVAQSKPLELRLDLRAGQVVAAVGRAPSHTRSPAQLIVAGLRVQDGQLIGELTGNLPSDGYSGAAAIRFDLKEPLAGRLQPRADLPAVRRLVLHCENALIHEKTKPQHRRLQLVLGLRNGQVIVGRAVPNGSLTDVNQATRMTRWDVKLTDGRLTGEVTVAVQPQDSNRPALEYIYALDGQLIGDLVTGQLRVRCNGQPAEPTGTFVGEVERGAGPLPADALYKLTLHDALGKGKFLDLYVNASGGRFTHGFATAPNFNNATHEVDLGGLKLADATVTGTVAVTVLPDPWIPQDQRPIPCSFELQANIAESEIIGQYSGTAGTNTVRQVLDGALSAQPKTGAVTGGTLKLEAALMGDGGFHSRVFVSFTATDGKVTGGKLSNNHSKLAGTVDGGQFQVKDQRLTGTIQATVTVGAGVWEGHYEFVFDTALVGTAGAGQFTSRLGTSSKRGRLWAVVKLAE